MPIDMASMANDIQNLKVAQMKAEMRYDGITAIIRRLIEANPEAVHVDEIEKALHAGHGHTVALRDEGHRRSDINEFLRDVGLIRRVAD